MMPGDLDVDVVQAPGHVTVVLRGELDTHGERKADAALDAAAGQAAHVVLDLRALDFIDSTGLKLALVWNRRLQDRGIMFSIIRGGPNVQRPFTSAGLDDLLPFADESPA